MILTIIRVIIVVFAYVSIAILTCHCYVEAGCTLKSLSAQPVFASDTARIRSCVSRLGFTCF